MRTTNPECLAACLRLQERILNNIDIQPESGCWLWRGRKNNAGYGIITCRVPGYRTPRPLFAHRVAWEAFRQRRMPRGRVGAHSLRCVARHCCNYEHIRATTQSANARDRERAKRLRRKGLLWPARGKRVNEFPPTHTVLPCARR